MDQTVCPLTSYTYKIFALDIATGVESMESQVNITTKAYALDDNLANGCSHVGNSQNFGLSSPASSLWDGIVSAGVFKSSAGNMEIDSFWVEYDLGTSYQLEKIKLFGDTYGSWVCKNFSVVTKLNVGDAYSNLVQSADCFGNQWFEKTVSKEARYIKLIVVGDVVMHRTQAMEFEVMGKRTGPLPYKKKVTSEAQRLLLKNYPNPFRPRTRIQYNTSGSIKDKLSIVVK